MNKKNRILLLVCLGALGLGILAFVYLTVSSRHAAAQPGKALARYDIQSYGSELTTTKVLPSPFTSNALWLLDVNNVASEFSIGRGKCQELARWLGVLADGLAKDGIVPDACVPKQIWITNFHQGLGLYDTSGKRKKFFAAEMFNNSSITALAFTRDDVWIGVSEGLYRYERATGALREITLFKEVWFDHLEIHGDSLIVNREFIYHPGANKVENASAKAGAKIVYRHGLRILRTADGLSISDTQGQVIADLAQTNLEDVYIDPAGGIWRSGDGLARYDPQSRKLVKLFVEQTSNLQYSRGYLLFSCRYGLGRIQLQNNRVTIFLAEDLLDYAIHREHLWLLTKKELLRLTNQDINFQPLAVVERIKALEDEMAKLLSSIWGDGEDGIVMVMKRAAAYFQQADALAFPLDDNARYTLKQALRLRSGEDRKKIEDYLGDADSRFEQAICLYLLATGPMLLGDPVAAYDNYKRLKADYPESAVLGLLASQDVALLAKTSQEYQQIAQAKMPEDERLWRLGRLFCDAATVEWNESECFYDYSLGYSYYEKLIKNHSKSRWADDADYKIFEMQDLHEGGDYSYRGCVEYLQSFIKRYPGSEYVAKANYQIGSHYYYFVQGMLDDRAYLTYSEAQQCLRGAKEAFLACLPQADEKRKGEIRDCLTAIERWLGELDLELQITAKEHYMLGEEIVLSFQLSNMSDKPRAIQLFGDSPQFGLIVYCRGEDSYDQIDFIRDLNAPLRRKTKTATLPPGGVFTEEQTPGIAAVAESDWNAIDGAAGKILFGRAGIYDVRAYYWEQGKEGKIVFASKPIKIVVEG